MTRDRESSCERAPRPPAPLRRGRRAPRDRGPPSRGSGPRHASRAAPRSRSGSGKARRCATAIRPRPALVSRASCPTASASAAVSDAGGEEALIVFRADGTGRRQDHRRRLRPRSLDLVPAPAPVDSAVVAFTNHRQEVWIANLAERRGARGRGQQARSHRRPRLVARRPLARVRLLRRRGAPASIHLFDRERGAIHEITRPEFVDFAPSFDPDGKLPLLPVAARLRSRCPTPSTSISASRAAWCPAWCRSRSDTPSPFDAALRAPHRPRAKPSRPDEPATATDDDRACSIDLEGIADRVVAFPMPEGRYRPDRRRPRPRVPHLGADRGHARRGLARQGTAEGLGQARGVGLRARPRRDAARERHRDRAVARRPHAAGPRRQPPARAAGARSMPATWCARTSPAASRAGSTSAGCVSRWCPSSSGGRCCARRGGCSATSSGPRTSRASTGRARSSATCRWSSASPRAPSSPT